MGASAGASSLYRTRRCATDELKAALRCCSMFITLMHGSSALACKTAVSQAGVACSGDVIIAISAWVLVVTIPDQDDVNGPSPLTPIPIRAILQHTHLLSNT